MIIDRKTQFYIDTFGKCPLLHPCVVLLNKGNNKITEHRAIFQSERQNS